MCRRLSMINRTGHITRLRTETDAVISSGFISDSDTEIADQTINIRILTVIAPNIQSISENMVILFCFLSDIYPLILFPTTMFLLVIIHINAGADNNFGYYALFTRAVCIFFMLPYKLQPSLFVCEKPGIMVYSYLMF